MSRSLLTAIVATRLLWWAILTWAPPLPVHRGEGTLLLPWKDRPDGTQWLYHPDRRIDAWGRNDTPYYFEIAFAGYSPPPLDRPTKEGFFPGYPIIVKGVQPWVHRLLLGGRPEEVLPSWALSLLLTSQVFAVAALVLFEKLAQRFFGATAGTRAAVLFALSPFSFLLGTALTDGPFLALALGAACAAERGRWILAGLCAGPASAVRVFGIALLALGPRIFRAVSRLRFAAAAGFAVLTLAGLAWALHRYQREAGDPWAYFKVQQLFGHESFPSLAGIRELFILRGYGAFEIARKVLQLVVFFWGLVALVCCALDVHRGRVPWVYWCLGAAWFFAPILADNLISLPRYALAAFPLYLSLLVRCPAGAGGVILGLAGLGTQGVLLLTWEAHWPFLI